MAVPTSADPYPYWAVGKGRGGEVGEVWNIKELILIHSRMQTHTRSVSLSHTVSVSSSLTYTHTHTAWVMKC